MLDWPLFTATSLWNKPRVSNSSGMLPLGGVLRQVVLCLLFSAGCVSKPVEEGTVDADPVAYEPPDTDEGADASGGTETGGDDGSAPVGDTGGGEADDADGGDDGPGALDCDQRIEQEPEDECVMRELECDGARPVLSTTKGSPSNWGKLEYLSWYCLVTDDLYDGPETVFAFTHPGTGDIEIQLHAPCGELDLFAVRWPFWNEDGSCPISDTSLIHCEGADTRKDDVISLYETSEVDYLIVVDGPEGELANFTLYADCSSE